MQFTGLLDKNGKEIYEGDIVEYSYRYLSNSYKQWDEGRRMADSEKETAWEKRRSVVECEHGCFKLDYPLYFHNLAGNLESYESGKYTEGLTEYQRRGDSIYADFREEYKNFEIIGNIYENPELLKGEKS